MAFLMDFGPKCVPKLRLAEVQIRSFFAPLSQGVFSKVPWLTLAPFWLHFCHAGAPIGYAGAPFGSAGTPFWLFLVPLSENVGRL